MSDRAPSLAPADVATTQPEPSKPDADIKVQEVEPTPLPSPTASVQVKEESLIPLLSRTGSVNTEESHVFIPSPVRKTRSEAERRTFLEDDPQAEQVESWKVLCRCCKKWIRLSRHSTYSISNWLCHKRRCGEHWFSTRTPRRTPSKPAFEPSGRIATAERKIALLNDPQVRECSPRHILCGTCRTVVVLDGDLDYNLVPWNAHKEKCIPKTPAPITTHERASRRVHVPLPTPSTSSTDSHISAGGSRRSPTPVGLNTETAATVGSPPAAAVKAGVKRGREEEEEVVVVVVKEVEEDARPKNRPRKETYEPPEGDAANVLGWLLLPLQSLARGFREGVGFT